VNDAHQTIALWENKICTVGKRTFPHDGNYDAQMFPTMYHLYACVCVCVCVCYDSNDEITRRFAELDKDRNGVLSPQEVVHVIEDMMGVDEQTAVAMMQMFDTNRDGSLDKTEFMQLWANMFGQ